MEYIDYFPCIKQKNKVAVLQSQKEYTYHLWTKNSTDPHLHNNYVEIFVLLKGEMNHRLENKTTRLQTGDFGVIFPNVPHEHFATAEHPHTELLNITCFTETASQIAQHVFHREMNNTSSQILTLTPSQLRIVKRLSSQILSSSDQKETDYIIASLFTYLMGLKFSQDTKRTDYPQWLNEFLSKLSTVDFSTTRISDLYTLSHYSQSTLSLKFREYFGMSLVQYFNDLRLQYACNLLEKTNMSVLEISNAIGFSSLAHFNNLFKEKYNMAPLQYRKTRQ